MSNRLETEIFEIFKHIEKQGITIDKKTSKKCTHYRISASNATIELEIEEKWISFNFELLKSKIFYSINSDLYDITKIEHVVFANEIKADILNFLRNLEDGNIKISYNGKHPLLLVPTNDGPLLLKEGRFLASATLLKSSKAIEKKI